MVIQCPRHERVSEDGVESIVNQTGVGHGVLRQQALQPVVKEGVEAVVGNTMKCLLVGVT
jgi:hypothetical protein